MKMPCAIAAIAVLIYGCSAMNKSGASNVATETDGFQKSFNVATANFASVGRNDYFILEPGYQHTYGDKDEQLIITVLNETKTVDGVETRIIEERESAKGKLVEVSRNFFAIDKASGDVYYFGEDVDMYKNGQITNHGGSWKSGEKGAHYGLFMPAHPIVGRKFYQEVAPGVAMDRCEVVSVEEKLATPAGSFERCVKMKETTPLESGKEYKVYGPKVGLLADADLKLVKHGPAGK
jgi:hypothetical protein